MAMQAPDRPGSPLHLGLQALERPRPPLSLAMRALSQASDWPLLGPVAWGCVAVGAAVCTQPPPS
eukprot:5098167-Alexandrium_andersonii.AAC.1